MQTRKRTHELEEEGLQKTLSDMLAETKKLCVLTSDNNQILESIENSLAEVHDLIAKLKKQTVVPPVDGGKHVLILEDSNPQPSRAYPEEKF